MNSKWVSSHNDVSSEIGPGKQVTAKFCRALEAMLSMLEVILRRIERENHWHFSKGREATCQSVFCSTWTWPERAK